MINPQDLVASVSNEDWRFSAKCRGALAVMFAEYESPRAKAICRTCDVRETCLDYALNNRITYGVWGGMSVRERRTEARRRRQFNVKAF